MDPDKPHDPSRAHYRVIDCTDGGAALGGQMLADLGHDVILVEPPGGAASRHVGPYYGDRADANRSLHFWATQRNKRSLELDLESDAGREHFERLLASTDVLIEAWRPGWLEARGLRPAALLERHPALIIVSITPFGRSGPKADWAATDLTVTAASGQMILCGDEDRAPLGSTVPQAFLHAGAEAAVGAQLALAARERDGAGQHVDVSAQTAMMMASQSMVLNHGWNDTPIERMGGGLRLGPLRIRFVYPCRDGYVNFTFLFGPALGPATARMFAWMHEEGFIDEATRDKDWVAYAAQLLSGQEPLEELERVTREIERFTRAHTKDELFRGAFERRVCLVPVSTVEDLLGSRQLRAREFWTDVDHPELDGAVTYAGPFVRLPASPIRMQRRPPLVGEHTRELLARELLARELLAAPGQTAAKPPATSNDTRPPLEGLRVLDFSWVYAGPAVTRVLADFGATVVRIESQTRIDALRPGQPFKDGVPGLERSGNYSNVNVGKLGLGLNMGVEGARELVLRLVDWADVVVENFSPRAMKAWDLDYATLARRKPGLVMLSSCLNGQTGPEAMLAGYGTMGAALGGFGFLTGWPDRPPSAPILAYTDYVSPRFATAALLRALDYKRRTGEGQHIDCSQAESSVHFLGPAVLDFVANGRVWSGSGNAHRDYAPSGVYPCAGDDRWIAIAAPDEATWRALATTCEPGWLDDARFASAPARLEHREALDAAVASWTKGHPVEALEQRLQAEGVPAHRVATSRDCFEDPQLQARDHFVELEHPECGPVPLENARVRLSRTPSRVERPGPMIGQHNDEILRELLGLDDDAIVDLVASGALE